VSLHVIVVGGGAAGRCALAELQSAGITDCATLDGPGHEVVSAVFDDAIDAWTLRTAAGDARTADVVVTAHRPEPWTPNLAGRNDFRGASFHAAQWDLDFDPSGKRIAVIGADATAGHGMARLTESAAAVTVFAHSPRRFVEKMPTAIKRWMRRPAPSTDPHGITKVRSAIDALTPSGVRTRDGAQHSVDAIVYGTGFASPQDTLVGLGGLTIARAWTDGMEPLHGVAVHGFPNYFFMTGPDVAAQAGYITDCLQAMIRTGSTRIEARRSSQQVFNERVYVGPAAPHPVASAFDLSATADDLDASYDGAATLTIGDAKHPVRVRLSGRLDPNDGRYHWQGTLFGADDAPLPHDALKQARAAATLTVGGRTAAARIMEQTPWGTHAVAGVGAPPFPSGEASTN
jgi:cation diffusion facilitator CzcD-associated flavoprotein CzcO